MRSNREYDYFGNVLEYEYDYFPSYSSTSTSTQKVLVLEYEYKYTSTITPSLVRTSMVSLELRLQLFFRVYINYTGNVTKKSLNKRAYQYTSHISKWLQWSEQLSITMCT